MGLGHPAEHCALNGVRRASGPGTLDAGSRGWPLASSRERVDCSAVVIADGRVVRTHVARPLQSGRDPGRAPRRSRRKRGVSVSSTAGVAAQAVDAVSLIAWPFPGFPKPKKGSISDRRWSAAWSPEAAMGRRRDGAR